MDYHDMDPVPGIPGSVGIGGETGPDMETGPGRNHDQLSETSSPQSNKIPGIPATFHMEEDSGRM
jgi:hypothetical protein